MRNLHILKVLADTAAIAQGPADASSANADALEDITLKGKFRASITRASTKYAELPGAH